MTDETKTIEAEAAETRERIADTIDELQARLSPKALVDNALGSLSSAGNNAVASLKGAATGHPLILGIAGLAVGIGLLARSRVQRATIEYGDSYAAYADYDEGYADNLAAGEPAVGAARAQLDRLHESANATVDDNPLAVLAVGAATGVLLGAVIPLSAVEGEMFGEVRARIEAAADAAVAAAKVELDPSKLSLKGGTAGLVDRLTQSLTTVLDEATSALARPVTTRSGN
ncbi:MAG: DUF3618 domain-containing protein [Sphingomonadaceae bacterium]|nr:DUF3618 domain-containing protein [Sphingomonadaceae bacterium]